MSRRKVAVEQTLQLGQRHQQAGDLRQAEQCYRKVLKLAPANPDALHLMGVVALQNQKARQAIDWISKAIHFKAHDATFHNHLAVAQFQLGQSAEAEASWRRALQITPDDPGVCNNLALAKKEAGRLDEAQALLERALQQKPDYADACYNLGNVRMDQGDFDAAIDCYHRTLTIDPNYAQAYNKLISSRKNRSDDRHLIDRAEALLSRGHLSREAQSQLHFALGKFYDDCQQWPQAFHHYQQANQKAGVSYDPRRAAEKIDTILQTCSRELLESNAAWGNPSTLPVFIVGMPRSGTTLVEQIIASHPQAFGGGELPIITTMTRTASSLVASGLPYPEFLASAEPADIATLAGQCLDRLRPLGGQALRVTDKLPGNFLHLGLIAVLFPRATIIHCRRDPLDVCLSCYFQPFAERLGFAYDLEHLGFYYRQYQKVMDHWRRVLPLEMLEVDYEQLVDETLTTTRRLIDFCGLEWDERCLQFHTTRRAVQTSSNWQVRQPIYHRSVQRWRNYEEFLGPLKKALGMGERQ